MKQGRHRARREGGHEREGGYECGDEMRAAGDMKAARNYMCGGGIEGDERIRVRRRI